MLSEISSHLMSKTYVEPTNPWPLLTTQLLTTPLLTTSLLTNPFMTTPLLATVGTISLPRIGGRNWVGRRASKARLVQSSISFPIPFLFIYLFIYLYIYLFIYLK